MSDGNQSQQPSLMGGHVQYAKGAAEKEQRAAANTNITTQSAIGGITGSQPWKASGEQDKAAAVAAMQKAGEKRDATHGYGKAEELAGKWTGCEGMQKEGAASKKHD
ncbi:csbD-like domain-containing protein [Purpureocillium lavendulum]|uniref:CsbD-like domain-containing protein n=1 Tax=Purpureocillium lavendulum TaxID=1247861 RepID=A0AB34G2C9_9HYPO|nr:csbD-like domain-containing protein [Purpureocillium lavendulum]